MKSASTMVRRFAATMGRATRLCRGPASAAVACLALSTALLLLRDPLTGVMAHSTHPGLWPRGTGDIAIFLQLSTGARGIGYIPFLPLFPYLIHWVSFVCGVRPREAGLVVSWLGASLGLWAVGEMARDSFGLEAAFRTKLYVLACPMSFYLVNGYSEGLFFGLSALSLLCATRSRWMLSIAFASAACLTRTWGLFLVPAIGAGWLRANVREPSGRPRLREIAGLALPVAAWLTRACFAVGAWRGPVLMLTVEHTIYRRTATLPMAGAFMTAAACATTDAAVLALNADKLLLLTGWAFTLWRGCRRLPLPLAVYLSSGALLLCYAAPYEPVPWESQDRMLMVLFPAYMVLGQMDWRPWAHRAVLSCLAAMLVLQYVVFLNG